MITTALEKGISSLFNLLSLVLIFDAFVLITTSKILMPLTNDEPPDRKDLIIYLALLLIALSINIGGLIWLLCNFGMAHPDG